MPFKSDQNWADKIQQRVVSQQWLLTTNKYTNKHTYMHTLLKGANAGIDVMNEQTVCRQAKNWQFLLRHK